MSEGPKGRSGIQRQTCARSPRNNSLVQASLSLSFLLLAQILAHSTAANAQATSAPSSVAGGFIQGVVKSGNTPIPGATVKASNPLTGQKVTAWTNVTGQYTLQVPANGRYVVKAQMPAFATITGEAVINATTPTQRVDLEIVLASRSQAPADETIGVSGRSPGATTGAGRGYQSLSVLNGEGAGLAASTGSDSTGSLDTPL